MDARDRRGWELVVRVAEAVDDVLRQQRQAAGLARGATVGGQDDLGGVAAEAADDGAADVDQLGVEAPGGGGGRSWGLRVVPAWV